MGSLNQDVQQYCLGTVNMKTVHWRWRWEAKTRTSNSIVLERSSPKLFPDGEDGKLKPGRQTVYCLGTVNTKTVHWRWRWED